MAEPRTEQNYPQKSIDDIYYILFRHKMKIILFFTSVMVVVVLGLLSSSKTYKSEAKLLVKLGRSGAKLDPTVTVGQTAFVSRDRESEVNSELEILKSRNLAEQVAEALGTKRILYAADETRESEASLFAQLRRKFQEMEEAIRTKLFSAVGGSQPSHAGEDLKEREEAVGLLTKNLKIESVPKSDIIDLAFKAQSPKLAHDVLNKLIDLYRDKQISLQTTPGSFKFFDEQTREHREALLKTEKELRDLKNSANIASLKEQRSIFLQRIGGLQKELEDVSSQLAGSKAKAIALKAQLDSLPKTLVMRETEGFPDSSAEVMRTRLYELQLKEQELLSTFTETSVPVTEIRRQVSETKALLKKARETRQVTKEVNNTYQEVLLALVNEESNRTSLEAKAQTLRKQLAEARNELKALNDTELKLAQLEREMEMQAANYKKYSESLEQTRIDQALEMDKISNIRVVQPATYPVNPVPSTKRLKLAMGFFLGIFGGVGLAFFSEFQDRTFGKPEHIEDRLQLPLFAAIPRVGKNKTMPIPTSKDFPESRDLFTQGGASISWRTIPPEFRRHYEIMVEYLFARLKSREIPPQSFSITSCRKGEGVTTVAVNFACALACHTDGRVLLISAVTKGLKANPLLGVRPVRGFSNLQPEKQGRLSLIQASFTKNIDVLYFENEDADFARFFESTAFGGQLNLWKREYGFIVFDSPPVWEGPEALSLGRLVDGVILVIEAEAVEREVGQKAKDRLVETGADVLGVVFNKRRFYVPKWLSRNA